jgi:hypothetical protein
MSPSSSTSPACPAPEVSSPRSTNSNIPLILTRHCPLPLQAPAQKRHRRARRQLPLLCPSRTAPRRLGPGPGPARPRRSRPFQRGEQLLLHGHPPQAAPAARPPRHPGKHAAAPAPASLVRGAASASPGSRFCPPARPASSHGPHQARSRASRSHPQARRSLTRKHCLERRVSRPGTLGLCDTAVSARPRPVKALLVIPRRSEPFTHQNSLPSLGALYSHPNPSRPQLWPAMERRPDIIPPARARGARGPRRR